MANFRDFRKVLMSSTKPLFCLLILHVWVIFWDFLERYLAETFRTINEVFKFMHFKTCFYFGDNTVVHFENCYAHFCYGKTLPIHSSIQKFVFFVKDLRFLIFQGVIKMFPNTISDLNQKERRITALE